MIFVDYNQIGVANLHASLHANAEGFEGETDKILIRNMILTSILKIKKEFKNYGELVIACDAGASWRKQIFPYYKANRKKTRDASALDWEKIYSIFHEISQDLTDYFPYPVVKIESIEADDIIAILSMELKDFKNVIVSRDHDFYQLHYLPFLDQYDYVSKKYIDRKDWRKELIEHIIKGDTGDGIPNILSDDNSLVIGKRQSPITKKKLEYYSNISYTDISDETIKKNWIRNQSLVDFSLIGETKRNLILNTYRNQLGKSRRKLKEYFMRNRMVAHLDRINEF